MFIIYCLFSIFLHPVWIVTGGAEAALGAPDGHFQEKPGTMKQSRIVYRESLEG